MAKATFFEHSTQRGYMLEVWNTLLPRHWEREIYSSPNGEKYGLIARKHGRDAPEIHHETTGRQQIESNQVWRDRVRGEAEALWNKYRKRREEAKKVAEAAEWERKAAFGLDGRAGSAASLSATQLLRDIALSTTLPTESVISSTGMSGAAGENSALETSGLMKPNTVISQTSTKVSYAKSKKTASKSLSSSTE